VQHRTGEPLVYSVEEVARILGISRGLAYQEARAYVITGGRAGIPTLKIGCRYVVPSAALREYLSLSVPHPGGEDDSMPAA